MILLNKLLKNDIISFIKNGTLRVVDQLPPVNEFAYVMSQKTPKKINIIIQIKKNFY